MKSALLIPIMGWVLFYTLTAQYSPNPAIWLKADQVGEEKTVWKSISSKTDASYSNGAFSTEEEGINFNPAMALEGDGHAFKLDFNPEKPKTITVLSVFQPGDDKERIVWAGTDCKKRKLYQSTKVVLGPNGTMDTYQPIPQEPCLLRVVQQWGKSVKKAETNGKLVLGGPGNETGLNESFKGMLAEFILFEQDLTETERVQFETYLAIKYGITLKDVNYVSSQEQVLWNRFEQEDFGNRIAGMGRDDAFGLYQKQSKSGEKGSLITMGLGTLAKTNAENPNQLEDQHFLIWGDDDKAIELATSRGEHEIPSLERSWRMQVNGEQASNVPVQVKLKADELGLENVEPCVLLIDRSGEGTFEPGNVDYIEGKLGQDGKNATFDQVHWDTDGNGKDAFTFGFLKEMVVHATADQLPNCESPESGQLAIQVMGGEAPYQISGREMEGERSISLESDGKAEWQQLTEGSYSISVSDQLGSAAQTEVSLDEPELFAFPWAELEKALTETQGAIDLSQIGVEANDLSYNWSGPSGFHSSNSKITLEASGEYQLAIADKNGCSVNKTFHFAQSELLRFEVYPSPLFANDVPVITAAFSETTPLTVEISDASGKVLHEWEESGKTEYEFRQPLHDTGVYIVRMQTPDHEYIKKIVVSE